LIYEFNCPIMFYRFGENKAQPKEQAKSIFLPMRFDPLPGASQ